VRQRNGAHPPTGDADLVFSTPSGNFGNLTAGLLAKRAGLPIARFVAATNANDVVPEYLDTGTFKPRPSVATLANAMDVGHPSNFERMMWLYGGDVDAMRRDIAGCHFSDDDVRATIRRVYDERGYLLDPHSAIAYKGLKGQVGRVGQVGIFLATAHPAKFAEIVEPIVGREIDKPAPLAQALARPRHIIRIEPSLAAVMATIDG
jgi:threonine synthase